MLNISRPESFLVLTMEKNCSQRLLHLNILTSELVGILIVGTSEKKHWPKAYIKNKFEKTREYLKLNYKYPEFSIGFRWVLRARCGYKFDARVTKAAKMIEEDCPESNPRLKHWLSKCYLFRVFRMKYFKDVDILYEKFYIISKYYPTSNSNVNTVITDMNNIELSSDSDSSNEVYNINNINNIVNNSRNSDIENRNINISDMNRSIGENRGNLKDADIIDLNYKKEWNILFKNQIISGDYSKTPFLVRSAALFSEIMPRASTRQGLLFGKYERKLIRRVNAENASSRICRDKHETILSHNKFTYLLDEFEPNDNLNPNSMVMKLNQKFLKIYRVQHSISITLSFCDLSREYRVLFDYIIWEGFLKNDPQCGCISRTLPALSRRSTQPLIENYWKGIPGMNHLPSINQYTYLGIFLDFRAYLFAEMNSKNKLNISFYFKIRIQVSFVLSSVLYYEPLPGLNKKNTEKAQSAYNQGLFWSFLYLYKCDNSNALKSGKTIHQNTKINFLYRNNRSFTEKTRLSKYTILIMVKVTAYSVVHTEYFYTLNLKNLDNNFIQLVDEIFISFSRIVHEKSMCIPDDKEEDFS
ncbi:hypothetical protein H8356DRAFT_1324470 [Neocallimastix lanati (nom. inval.)]|nr:hypothetical protein H8356DRAFT_1324470 [Neocallimastix sp. JGI-2020a]